MVEEIRNKSFSQRSGVYSLFFKLEVSTFIPVNNLAQTEKNLKRKEESLVDESVACFLIQTTNSFNIVLYLDQLRLRKRKGNRIFTSEVNK